MAGAGGRRYGGTIFEATEEEEAEKREDSVERCVAYVVGHLCQLPNAGAGVSPSGATAAADSANASAAAAAVAVRGGAPGGPQAAAVDGNGSGVVQDDGKTPLERVVAFCLNYAFHKVRGVRSCGAVGTRATSSPPHTSTKLTTPILEYLPTSTTICHH